MSKTVEEWRPVVGYEGLYEVSDWGRVRSLDRYVECNCRWGKPMKQYFKGKMLNEHYDKYGYLQVNLTVDGKTKTKKIHRLVAEAFIPNPNRFPEINHIDENKINNIVENLEWCDAKYNCNYGTRIERIINPQRKKINQYTIEGEFVRSYNSMAEAEQHGFSHGCICMCCKGIKKQHKGYVWKYA